MCPAAQERAGSWPRLRLHFTGGEAWFANFYELYFTRTPFGRKARTEEEAILDHALDMLLAPEHFVADIGCGTGYYAAKLARRCAKVIALDPSPSMLRYTRRRISRQRIRNVEIGHALLPGPLPLDRVDGIISMGALNYVEQMRESVQNMAAALRPGGWMVITVPPDDERGRHYERQERHQRRKVYLRTDAEVESALASAGLQVLHKATAVGITRFFTTRLAS